MARIHCYLLVLNDKLDKLDKIKLAHTNIKYRQALFTFRIEYFTCSDPKFNLKALQKRFMVLRKETRKSAPQIECLEKITDGNRTPQPSNYRSESLSTELQRLTVGAISLVNFLFIPAGYTSPI